MINRRVVALLLGLTAICVLLEVGQAFAAVSAVHPNPPTAGQTFHVTGSCGVPCTVQIYSGSTCSGTVVSSVSMGAGTYDLLFGLSAGQYSVTDGSPPLPNCYVFHVDPGPAATYYPVGGQMLSLNLIRVILPWFALIAVLTTISIWTVVVKRNSGDN